MTTAFQIIFDRAQTIAMQCRPVVAQTISRSNVVRSTSRGGQVWSFDVRLPDGILWTDIRSAIAGIEYADRYTLGTVQLNDPGLVSWLTPYQGDGAKPAPTDFTATWTQGDQTIYLYSGTFPTSGYRFKAGDLLQLTSTGRVYQVAVDVPWNQNSVTLNRPVIDASGSGPLVIGSNVTWSVYCTTLPTWSIFQRNQVAWSGSFAFYEALI